MVIHIRYYKFFLSSLLILTNVNLQGAESRKEKRKQEKIDAVIQNFGEQNVKKYAPNLLETDPKFSDLTLEQRHRADLLAYATICGHKQKKSPEERKSIALTILKLQTGSALWASENVEQETKNYIALEAFFKSANSDPILKKTQEDFEVYLKTLESQRAEIELATNTLV